ncbi:BrxA family protein [uncultured Methanospirillum sp.]|uniref:BrxA family protein n=1 Tax=uncultured Methanospirillum sp. TaxID=262503 RepID=UPI0029C7D806|nr:BrxA family protein [uncultured Methanospirillum sp.]
MSAQYTSKILKASALIDDTLQLLSTWDISLNREENLAYIRDSNILAKPSRSRLEDVLVIFKHRYLYDDDLCAALHILVNHRLTHEVLYPILFFLTVRSDLLIHDLLVGYIFERRRSGADSISSSEIDQVVQQYVKEGKTITSWSPKTTIRVAQHFLALLRDFGIFEGRGKKHFAPFLIPNASFAFLSFYLQKQGFSGQQLVTTDEWKILFLEKDLVERFYVDCEQDRLLIYNAAWPVIRIDYPSPTLAEYAHVIINRTN